MASGLLENLNGLTMPGVRWLFTTRQGGVSCGPYAGWNLGSHVGDQPDLVAANRRQLTDALGLPADRLLLLNQVHGAITHEATWPWPDPPLDGDALVTNQPGHVIGVLVADCAPVVLADPQARVIGAAHAGWRGALAGVLESCLAAMEQLGAHVERTQAVIGPCIRSPAYQVDADFRDRLLAAHIGQPVIQCFTKDQEPGKFQFDLPGYVRMRLTSRGMRACFIHDLARCTHANPELFFSHRRTTQQVGPQGVCGRQLGGVLLV